MTKSNTLKPKALAQIQIFKNRTNLKFSHLFPKKFIWAYINEKLGFWPNLALQKQKKMDFWSKLDLPNLAEHGWGLPQYPPSIPNKPF